MNAITNLPWTASNAPTATDVQKRLEALFEELRGVEMSTAQDAELTPLVLSLKYAGDYAALVHAEIEARVLKQGKMLPGVSIGEVRANRIWSDVEATTALARTELGDEAFTAPTLKSPAQIEKLGKKGKDFVALCSEKPEAGKKVVY